MSDDLPAVSRAPGLTIDTSGPIRKWVDTGIQQAMDKALATLEEDKHVAVIAVADLKGAKLAAVAKLPMGWSVMGVFDRDWSGNVSGQVAVKWSI